MVRSGDVLDVAALGVRLEIRRTSAESGGELVELDVVGRARGFLTQPHVHARQVERLEVIEGSMRLVVDGETRVLGPGRRRTTCTSGSVRRRRRTAVRGGPLPRRRAVPPPVLRRLRRDRRRSACRAGGDDGSCRDAARGRGPVLANASLIAAAIVANVGFEPIGLDLVVVALVAALSLALLKRAGPRPIIVYFAWAYAIGLLATIAVRLA